MHIYILLYIYIYVIHIYLDLLVRYLSSYEKSLILNTSGK